jgi:hypothetical protein
MKPDTPLSLLALYEKNRPCPDDDPHSVLVKKITICEITVAFRTYQMDLPLEASLKELVCEAGAAAIDALAKGRHVLAEESNEVAAGEFRSAYGNLVAAVTSFLWKYDRAHLWPLAEKLM